MSVACTLDGTPPDAGAGGTGIGASGGTGGSRPLDASDDGSVDAGDAAIDGSGGSSGKDGGLAGSGGTGGGGPLCSITRVKQTQVGTNASKVYFGTLQPTVLGLTRGQMLAIGRLDMQGTGLPSLCSGTLITTSWVLTAKHCTEGLVAADITFAIGHMPNASDRSFTVTAIQEHPVSDVALLQLSEVVTDSVPDVTPIRLFMGSLDDTWIGNIVEAAGYGETADLTLGTRYFTAEPIDSFLGDEVWVNGQGQHGLCGGDSGGPLMTQAADGSIRVIGELHGGDTSCLDVDHYTRVDLYRSWIEQHVGPTPVSDGVACGALTVEGTCSGDNAVFCGGKGVTQTQACSDVEACGWSDSAQGFRCVSVGTDPCDGYDGIGVCVGQVATACIGGTLQAIDCAACGLVCRDNAIDGVNCIPVPVDPCDGLNKSGRCNGDVAEWCDNGVFNSRDCAVESLACAWRGLPNGYWCE